MKILAIEFSSEQRSVAVAAEGRILSMASEIATRATHAFTLIETALAQAGLGREEIECLAIGLGPGSYTGIRSAIALAQGWQLALPVKLLGISSVESIAAEARTNGWFGKVNILIDAQRNEFYLARYEIGEKSCCEIDPLKLAAIADLGTRVSEGEMIVGPEVKRWFGEGRTVFPNASSLAGLAEGRSDFVDGETLEPVYLRETNFIKAPPLRVLPGI